MTRIADSSFLIALFDFDDPRRREAVEWASSPESIEVLPEVLGETLGVVHRRVGFKAALAIYEGLSKTPNVVFSPEVRTLESARAFHEGQGRLSWVDACVVAACRALSARPLCFDPAILRAVGGA